MRQLEINENYELLQPVYLLNLVNDIFEPDMPQYYHYYRLVHSERTDNLQRQEEQKSKGFCSFFYCSSWLGSFSPKIPKVSPLFAEKTTLLPDSTVYICGKNLV